jgi:hypothetical protein
MVESMYAFVGSCKPGIAESNDQKVSHPHPDKAESKCFCKSRTNGDEMILLYPGYSRINESLNCYNPGI